MKKINIRALIYHLRHNYLNLNNLVVVVAFLVAASWAWGSINVMQRNYDLQNEIQDKKRQLKLVELQTANLRFQQRYFRSDEFKELAVRDRLGLADPGEHVLILPDNSSGAKKADEKLEKNSEKTSVAPSNFEQWMNFIFGGNTRRLQK